MYARLKELLFVLVFVGLLPGLIVSMIHRGRKEENEQITKPTDTSFGDIITEDVAVSVLMDDGTVAEMTLDTYLTAVILREMPAKFEVEALKAQAVVARTYTLKRFGKKGKHDEADVCTKSSCCQGFYAVSDYIEDGGKEENVQKIQKAVADTEGKVIVYRGELIDATYFSCSGGMTEDAYAVWGRDVPYLRATVSPGEENAKHYVDTVSIPVTEFAEKLDIDYSDGQEISIDSVIYTAGGGVDTAVICGTEIKGTTLRKKLDLYSTAMLMTVVGDGVTITTKGYGHRVGMSQYGANAMAGTGASWEEILLHYYTDTEIVTYKPD